MNTMADAKDLRFPDLVWSHFSRPRFGQFDERVAAAAANGFRGIGLYAYDYRRMRDDEGRSAAELRDVLAAHGMVIAEIEIVRGWWATSGPAYDEFVEMRDLAFEMADEFGCRYLQAISGVGHTHQEGVTGFRSLGEQAADHGLLVGVEWLPYTTIATVREAQRLVEDVDLANCGYCVDLWHHTRTLNDLDTIRAINGEQVFCIQLDDGPVAQSTDLDYRSDCLVSRVPPGDGEFDCAGFLRTLADMGVTAPISVEVCSADLWEAPVEVAARASAEGTRRVLAAAGLGR